MRKKNDSASFSVRRKLGAEFFLKKQNDETRVVSV